MAVTLPSAASVPSRTTGYAPLGVFFDAVSTTSTVHDTATKAVRYIDYRWDSGDTESSGSGNWPISGKAKRYGWGPMFFHCYEVAGTYTWRLWARDVITGDPVHTSGTIVVSVGFVDATSFCFNPLSDADFSWAPSYATSNRTSTDTWSTITAAISAGRQVLLKPGATWAMGTTTLTLPSTGPGRFGGYGGTAFLTFTGTGNGIKFAGTSSDWRVTDLEITGNGTNSGSLIASGGSSATGRTLVLRVDGTGFAQGYAVEWTANTSDENYLVSCDFSGIGASGSGNAIFPGGHRYVIIGCTVDGVTASCEHIVRPWHTTKGLLQHSKCWNPSFNAGKHCLKLYNESGNGISPIPPDTEFFLASDNSFKGGGPCVWAGPQSGSNPGPEAGSNLIFERNIYYCTSETQNCFTMSWSKATIRNEIAVGDGSYVQTVPTTYYIFCGFFTTGRADQVPTDVDFLNCTIYKSDGGAPGEVFGVHIKAETSNWRVRNCLLVYLGTTASVDDQVLFDEDGTGTATNNIEHTTTGDLVDPAAGDFHLQSGSTAIAAGGSTDIPVYTDYYELKRPQNTTWDVGAAERSNGESWTFDEGSPPAVAPVRNLIYCA